MYILRILKRYYITGCAEKYRRITIINKTVFSIIMFAVFSSYLFADSLDVNNEPDEERIVEYGSHWSNWIVKPYDFFSHPGDYWFFDNVNMADART